MDTEHYHTLLKLLIVLAKLGIISKAEHAEIKNTLVDDMVRAFNDEEE